VTTTGANQSGNSLILTATAGDTFKKGDKFSILNVNSTNPMTYRVAGVARRSSSPSRRTSPRRAAEPIRHQFLPPIYGPGSQYQNVDSLPANAGGFDTLAWERPHRTPSRARSDWLWHPQAFAHGRCQAVRPEGGRDGVERPRTRAPVSRCARSRRGTRFGRCRSTAWIPCSASGTCTPITARFA
jgi:hypothetical protein